MYFIYGKTKDMKKFKLLDLNNGMFVTNVIYGTFYDTQELAEQAITSLREQNPDVEFKYMRRS